MRETGRPFVKVAAAGNDLVLLDARDRPVPDPPRFARAVCDRHFGVGGDGLMLIESSSRASAMVRMFNPDGTEDFCGNGMRCVAAYLAGDGGEVRMASPLGLHGADVKSAPDGDFQVAVDLVSPGLAPADVPVDIEGDRAIAYSLEVDGASWQASSVSVGTTHTVVYLEEPLPESDFERYSPKIEVLPLFPERTSVLWCVARSPDRVEMRIWERGVGETLSCGTGACAAVVVGRLLGVTGPRATVQAAGGALTAEWDGDGPARLMGPVRPIYRGRLTPRFCEEAGE